MILMYISDQQLLQIEKVIREVTSQNNASVRLSIISICVAIAAVVVSVIMAHTQNKIALHEKRMECYLHFQALGHFIGFFQKWESFQRAETVDPIYQCQQKYLNIHYDVLDRMYLQNLAIMENNYAKQALEKDRVFFQSLLFLGILDKKFDTESLYQALESFVTELFIRIRITEMEDVKNTHFKELEKKLNDLCKQFDKMQSKAPKLTLEDKFKKKLTLKN